MSRNIRFFKIGLSIFVFVVLAAVFLSRQFAPPAESAVQKTNAAPDKQKLENYDIRTDQSDAARAAIAKFTADAGKSDARILDARKSVSDAAERLRAGGANLKIEYNEDLRIPEVITPDYNIKAGFLTAPSAGKRADVLEIFLRQNAALFGLHEAQIAALETSADYTNPNGALSFVHFDQKIGKIPVFRGEVKAGFTKRGEIVRVINNLAPGLDDDAVRADFGDARQSVLAAAKHIGATGSEADVKVINGESDDLKITFESGQFADRTTAEKMYFPVEYGVARAAWRVLLWNNPEAFYVIVDAQDGTLLWRKSITEYQTRTATFSVYGNTANMMKTADSPTPSTPGCLSPLTCPQPPMIARQSFTLVGNEPPYTFNNLGWIPDNGLAGEPNQSDNITDGNNVEAGVDRVAPNGVDAPVPGNPNRVFNFTYNPAPGNPPPGDDPLNPEFQKGAVTHAFYTINRWHDEMYLLGFTEQARNFQHFNFGRGGGEGDRISLEVQDSAGFNNANMAVTADGARPRIQMYLWNGTTPWRDGSLDAHILVHEASHGLSLRLHGNTTGLGTTMAAGLGEGWSDFYPITMLSEPSDNFLGVHPVGGYAAVGLSTGNSGYYYGARRFPYAVKAMVGENGFPHNPLTLAHLNTGNCATFNGAFPPRFTSTACGAALFIGEFWATALWEVRGQMVLRYGAVEGNRRALQIVTDAMKLSPLNPTIVQSRDAVLAAAQINSATPETDTDYIAAWRGFALRGLGVGATVVSTSPVSVTESFSLPQAIRPSVRADFDGDDKSDISVFRPTERVWYLNRSTSGFGAVQFGFSTDKLAPADYDGDRKTDIAVFRDGTWFLLRSNAGFAQIQFGVAGDVPVAADYDGDGKAEIAVFREGVWYSYNLANGQIGINGFGQAGDLPTPSDYDGDGRADQAVYRAGIWHLNRSTLDYTSVQFGIATDKPVQADYDGDGKTDLAVYRDGTWFMLNSAIGSATVNWGISSDIPAPGDYDGDGKTDQAVYRDGTWWILRSTAGVAATQFGLSGDMPVANRYLP